MFFSSSPKLKILFAGAELLYQYTTRLAAERKCFPEKGRTVYHFGYWPKAEAVTWNPSVVKIVEHLSTALAPDKPITSLRVEQTTKPIRKVFHSKSLAIRIHDGQVKIGIYSDSRWHILLSGKLRSKKHHSLFLQAGCAEASLPAEQRSKLVDSGFSFQFVK